MLGRRRDADRIRFSRRDGRDARRWPERCDDRSALQDADAGPRSTGRVRC